MQRAQGRLEKAERTRICEKEMAENRSMLTQFKTLVALRMNTEVAEGIGNTCILESGKGEFPNSRWSTRRLTAEYGSGAAAERPGVGALGTLV